jgi:hypothetical protein
MIDSSANCEARASVDRAYTPPISNHPSPTTLRIFPNTTPKSPPGAWAIAWCLLVQAKPPPSLTGAWAKAWCLLLHAEASLSLSFLSPKFPLIHPRYQIMPGGSCSPLSGALQHQHILLCDLTRLRRPLLRPGAYTRPPCSSTCAILFAETTQPIPQKVSTLS